MNEDLKRMLRNCFGEIDRNFAIHPLDRRAAREMLRAAAAAGATIDDIEREARGFLAADGCGQEHIEKQIEAIRALHKGAN